MGCNDARVASCLHTIVLAAINADANAAIANAWARLALNANVGSRLANGLTHGTVDAANGVANVAHGPANVASRLANGNDGHAARCGSN